MCERGLESCIESFLLKLAELQLQPGAFHNFS
jgi:hypothetical protein